jgi:hypothetical protein
MSARWILASLLLTLGFATAVSAQFQEGDPGGTKLGQEQVSRWRCGVVITAVGGACKGISGYVPVPTDWPEQQIKIVEEDISPEISINYQMVDGAVRVMTIKVPQLENGKEAKALVTFEIRRNMVLAPEKTDGYRFVDANKLDPQLRNYLVPSPKIESRDAKIRALAKEIGADKPKAWDHVEAIYDWVREHVKYKMGSLKGAVAALKDGDGECEDLSSLFIAICRAAGIPARTVWVPGHCYPEFYLLDDKGAGHWFPCQASGSRAFGCIPETKPILQKGDNFRSPHSNNPRDRQRYLAEYLKGKPTPGGGKPSVRWVREVVN